jgi:flagellar hook-basal body complex protein FliE
MVEAIGNLNVGKVGGAGVSPAKVAGAGASPASSFADVLKQSMEEVSRQQQDASAAVEDLMTGKTDNITGVMTAVEKADLAFKTLLAIRAKLIEAYEEVKNIQI